MILWVACIVFILSWEREGKQLLTCFLQWRAGSWHRFHIYLSRSTCTPGADVRPSSHKSSSTRGSCCLVLLLPVLGSPAQTPALSPDKQISFEKGWVKIWHFSICRSAWMLTPCLHKTEVSMCVFLPTHQISSPWQMNQKASVCIGLINSLFLSVSNLLKYLFGALFQACCWKQGSHYWHRRRYCHKPHKISEFIKGQLKQ